MKEFKILAPTWAQHLDGSLFERLKALPTFQRDKLYTLGDEGFNNHLMSAVCALQGEFNFDESFEILRSCADSYSRDIDDSEIFRALHNRSAEFTGKSKKPKWNKINESAIKVVTNNSEIRNKTDFQDKYGGNTLDGKEIISRLFPEDSLLCLSPADQRKAKTKKLSDWSKGEALPELIVASAMTRTTGINLLGKSSTRCLDNTGERMYLVIEQDQSPPDVQLAIIDHLASYAPLAMLLHSGGKSYHAWFWCEGIPEDSLREFMNYAVMLGADKATFTKCQLVRTPLAIRSGNGNLQEVITFRHGQAIAEEWRINDLPINESEDSSMPRIYSSEELQEHFPYPPRPVIQNVLGVGEKLMLSASSKAGKTWAMLRLARAVGEGASWFGFECMQGKVLFLNFELSSERLAERLKKITSDGMLEDVDFMTFRGKLVEFQALEQRLKRTEQKYSLMILDPVYKLLGEVDENNNGEVAQLLHKIEKLAVKAGTAVAYSHHFSKGNKARTDQIDRASGAGAWSRDPDALLSLTPHTKENHFTLEATLRNFSTPKPQVWEFNFPDFHLRAEEDPTNLKGASGANKKGSVQTVINLLKKYPSGINQTDLSKALEKGDGQPARSTVNSWIKQAKDQELIKINDLGMLIFHSPEDEFFQD